MIFQGRKPDTRLLQRGRESKYAHTCTGSKLEFPCTFVLVLCFRFLHIFIRKVKLRSNIFVVLKAYSFNCFNKIVELNTVGNFAGSNTHNYTYYYTYYYTYKYANKYVYKYIY